MAAPDLIDEVNKFNKTGGGIQGSGMDLNFQMTESLVKTSVAIKKLKKRQVAGSKNGVMYLLNEIRVHWHLEQCSSVLKLLQLFEDENAVYMVLEYQPKGTLMTVLEGNQTTSFTETQARVIVE